MLKCSVCGINILNSSYGHAILCDRDECFKRDFWDEYVAIKDKPEIARINGWHYYIEDEHAQSGFRGFSGNAFTIKFNDGRIVETTNLWTQGKIPEEYKEILADNAKFA